MKVRRSNRFRSRRLLAKKSLRSLHNSKFIFNKAFYSNTCHLRTDYGAQSIAVLNAIQELKKKGDSQQMPSEIVRRDFISAMKLPDNGFLSPEVYWTISDPWRSEWDKGVHVPVNLTQNDKQNVRKIEPFVRKPFYFRPNQRLEYKAQPNTVCPYDMDELDVLWLYKLQSKNRILSSDSFEVLMLLFERTCRSKLKEQISRVLVYDQSVVCDVCQSPNSEENDEMVFCDGCNVCVHQSCYGITSVPDGPWLCQPCSFGLKVNCSLCPNSGGALKCTRSKKTWCHLSCAVWIPETTIGNMDTMAPILNFSKIPAARWSLVCCICHVKSGACIQCSMKTCRKAFHVTCGFKSGLQMEISGRKEREVIFKSLCPLHGHVRKENACSASDKNEDEKQQLLCYNPPDFYANVDPMTIARTLGFDEGIVCETYNYWKMKRIFNENKPLIDLEDDDYVLNLPNKREKMIKYLICLRQDLEKVRNLCYMVTKREKLRREYNNILFREFSAKVQYYSGRKHLSKNQNVSKNLNDCTNAFDSNMTVSHETRNLCRSRLFRRHKCICMDEDVSKRRFHERMKDSLSAKFNYKPRINSHNESAKQNAASLRARKHSCRKRSMKSVFWVPSTPCRRYSIRSELCLLKIKGKNLMKSNSNVRCEQNRFTKRVILNQKQQQQHQSNSHKRNLRSYCKEKPKYKANCC